MDFGWDVVIHQPCLLRDDPAFVSGESSPLPFHYSTLDHCSSDLADILTQSSSVPCSRTVRQVHFGCSWTHQMLRQFCFLTTIPAPSPPQPPPPQQRLALFTAGAGGGNGEARRRGWRRMRVSRATWRPGRRWRRHPRPPPALLLRGAPG